MSMSKQDFIALADEIIEYNKLEDAHYPPHQARFTHRHLVALADFCYRQNNAFKRDRWFAYIAPASVVRMAERSNPVRMDLANGLPTEGL